MNNLKWKICWWLAEFFLHRVGFSVCRDCGTTYETWYCVKHKQTVYHACEKCAKKYNNCFE